MVTSFYHSVIVKLPGGDPLRTDFDFETMAQGMEIAMDLRAGMGDQVDDIVVGFMATRYGWAGPSPYRVEDWGTLVSKNMLIASAKFIIPQCNPEIAAERIGAYFEKVAPNDITVHVETYPAATSVRITRTYHGKHERRKRG